MYIAGSKIIYMLLLLLFHGEYDGKSFGSGIGEKK